MTADDHASLDPDIIAGLRQLARELENEGFVEQLVTLFQAHAPGRIETIARAIAAGDGTTLEATAHTLVSNCAMLGATRMAAYCRSLELAGGRGAFDEAAALLPDARAEFARVARAVARLTEPA